MATRVSLRDAKARLSALLNAVHAGEQVIIERRGPGGTVTCFQISEVPHPNRGGLFGALRGQFDPLPTDEGWAAADEQIQQMFDASSERDDPC